MFFPDQLDLSNLRIFSCAAYATLPPQLRDGKFSTIGVKCVFVGYDSDHKAYRLYHPVSKKIFVSNQVTFDENDFQLAGTKSVEVSHTFDTGTLGGVPPYPSSSPSTFTTSSSDELLSDSFAADGVSYYPSSSLDDISDVSTPKYQHSCPSPGSTSSITPVQSNEGTSVNVLSHSSSISPKVSSLTHSDIVSDISDVNEDDSKLADINKNVSTITVSQPNVLVKATGESRYKFIGPVSAAEFYNKTSTKDKTSTWDSNSINPGNIGIPSADSVILNPNTFVPMHSSDESTQLLRTLLHNSFASPSSSPANHTALTAVVNGITSSAISSSIPTTFKQAMFSPDKDKWYAACLKELKAFKDHDTYQLAPLPAGRRALGSRWVFTIKDNNRYKARLVAQGHTQKAGIDYQETFAPVVRYDSVRIFLALAALLGLRVH